MAKLKNIHPGEVLMEEFLSPIEMSVYRLAKEINVPQTRLSEIIKGRRSISADTALRLRSFFWQFTLSRHKTYKMHGVT